MYELTSTEHDAVLKLNADYRRSHFETKVKAEGEFCLIVDADGPYMLEDPEQEGGEWSNVLPVWPHETFAREFIEAQGIENAEVKHVTVKIFNEQWVPFLRENKVAVGYLPVPGSAEFEIDEPQEL